MASQPSKGMLSRVSPVRQSLRQSRGDSVGNFTQTSSYYYTSLWRTGYDNRTPLGRGNIQLVTPTLTHWLNGYIYEHHTAQTGMLTIQVPEPGAVVLLTAGGGVLGLLYWMSRRV